MNKKADKPQNRVEMDYYSNGMVISKTPFINDKRHGRTTWYQVGGEKAMEVSWKEGKKHGVETVWYEDGTKWKEKMWRAGEMHGVERWWAEDGKKAYEQMWRAGKKHGMETQWYEKSGLKWLEKCFVNNALYAGIEWDLEKSMSQWSLPPPTTTTAKPPNNPIIRSRKSYQTSGELIYM